MNELLSIIILTYNSEEDIKDCLDSLLKNFDDQKAEIIIWDNNSQDKTKEILKNYEKYSFIKIVYSDRNLGFAQGNNEASKLAEGKYILLLNADTISNFKVFEELIDHLEKNPNIGVIGPKCVDENNVIQESFGNKPSLFNEIFGKIFMSLYLEKFGIIRKIKNKILYKEKPEEVGWVGGACAIIRKDLWDKLNGLDPTYFFSNGDMIDFCYKVSQMGYKIIYYPLVSIIHKGSRAVTKDLNTRILGLKNGYIGTLYLFKNHKKNILYIYLTKLAFIIISFLKGISALFLSLFRKSFREVGLSHLIVSFWLIKNFFENDFIKLCQK